ncbi:MAG: M14 family metallopeptidase [Sediminibacterium sp.]|nr:M14 family metallopeptidase [Sediminibacterium sp.]
MKHLLLVCCLLVSTLSNIAQKIPTPSQHFGFSIGDDYMLATFTQTEAYFKQLAATSDRVRMISIGKTEEGRDQPMLIVTSPANLKKLDDYKTISRRLALAENLSDAEARALAASGKAIVWIDGGLHANEVVGAHQLIETAYQLASRQDEETKAILDNVIILMTHANPDGQELVSEWYMRNPVKEKRNADNLPRLYEKYAGHDNNRDFYMLNLKETQNMCRQLYIEWLPQIMYNHHQSGPPGSVVAGPPFRDPFNYAFDPIVITSLEAVGAAMINRLNVENKPGYTNKNGSVYSTWYNGGLRTTTYFHNMIGLLTEIIGSPNPSNIPLVPDRLVPNSSTPNPVLPGPWRFRKSIDYSVSLNYAVLNYAMRYRDELLFNIYRMGKNSIDKGSKDHWALSPNKSAAIKTAYQESLKNNPGNRRGSDSTIIGARTEVPVMSAKWFDTVMKNKDNRDARAFFMPPNSDEATTIRFLNALIGTGVMVHQTTAAVSIGNRNYPAGTWVVMTNQAFRPHILDLFEPQDHPNDFAYPGGPPVPPYDAAGWTLAYTMGIQFDRIMDEVNIPMQRLPFGEPIPLPSAGVPANEKGWILDSKANYSFTAINSLLQEGIEVSRIPDTIAGNAAGSFFVSLTPKNKSKVQQLVAAIGAKPQPTQQKPLNLLPVKAARIAIWDQYGGSMPSGWTRYLMEQFRFPYEVIFARDIDSTPLKDRFDVIIFVGGAIPAPSGAVRGREINKETIPAVYHPRLGRISAATSIPALKNFAESGGTIVCIGSSAQLAYHFKLPVADALVEMVNGQEKKLPNEKYYIPGSVLSVSNNNKTPAGWGMPEKTDVYFDESPVFRLQPAAQLTGQIKPLAWFSSATPLRSGWAWGQSYLKDGITAFEAQMGKGKLLVFGPEINFRAQTYGSFRWLFNPCYLMSSAN